MWLMILNDHYLKVVEPFEVMILAILSAALKCQWKLDYGEEATITTVKWRCSYILLYL